MSLAQGIFHSPRTGATIFGLGQEPSVTGWTETSREKIRFPLDVEAFTLFDPNSGASLYVPPVGTTVSTQDHPDFMQQTVYTEPTGRVVYDWQMFGFSGPQPRVSNGSGRRFTIPGFEITGRRWFTAGAAPSWLAPAAILGALAWWLWGRKRR